MVDRLRPGAALAAGLAGLVLAAPAAADPTSGIDAALFRGAYDSGGVFGVEGAHLLPARDLSFRVLVGYARAPISMAVPGIGDDGRDLVLDYLMTFDLAFALSITDRFAIGLDAAAYRAATSDGYGVRGRYASGGAIAMRSTGLIALRPLSNIDPSAPSSDPASYLGDGLAGPLDARLGAKYALVSGAVAVTAVASVFLPFGEDEMLLGDRDLVFEPKLAVGWRPQPASATKLVGNVGARLRRRTVLEGYDAADPQATEADARVVLDVGSELIAAVGGVVELSPRWQLGAEAQLLLPLPAAASWGSCRRHAGTRCETIDDADYFGDARTGDPAALATLGAMYRVSPDVTASVMVGAGVLGARGDDVRFTTGLSWSPQPAGSAAPGRADRDGDGIPDSIDGCPGDAEDRDGHQDEDGCPELDNDGDGILDADDRCVDEPEDKDGFEDDDGCPELDNDGDDIPDAMDRCPGDAEDQDGFEDDDGCPDLDNDRDGFPDAIDRCPNDPETVNGVEDDDGCPDVRGAAGPEERSDRIDLNGAPVSFEPGTAKLTAPARQLLALVAVLLQARGLSVRVEVHVALGTQARGAAQVAAQRRRDRQLTQQRARAVRAYLVSLGVPAAKVRAVGIGADRPLGTAAATDAVNERVDFLKVGKAGTP